MLCARCRAPIAEGARFCKHCGAKAAAENAAAGASICPNCQTPLPLNMKFCRHCGASLTALKRPAADGDSVPVVPLAPDDARAGGKKFLPTAALAGVFVLAIGIALFAVFAGKEETPEAPNVAPSTAEPAPSAAAPTAPTSPATASTTAPAAHPAATPAAPPIAAAPPPPPPKKAAAPSAPAAAAEPAPPPKTCDGVSGFSILLCRAEGPQRFWRCAPDGVNWDNDIPGCQRDTGNRNRIY